jgi:ferredoxin
MTKPTVDKSLCIACGACVSSCPDCFEFGEDGKSQGKECDGSCCDLHEVADNCPVSAITVE